MAIEMGKTTAAGQAPGTEEPPDTGVRTPHEAGTGTG
ncbi:hypothetical protein SAVIM40S_01454 [Streptomyces avidinii]|uniref:Uncharacterized protein n=1 Tax=Streptomyces avidinii TaxID=1895 RepID=A0ABS4L6M8_STRAV|nr:hypothetical protein [Streptomyces avidinii]